MGSFSSFSLLIESIRGSKAEVCANCFYWLKQKNGYGITEYFCVKDGRKTPTGPLYSCQDFTPWKEASVFDLKSSVWEEIYF